MAFTPRDIMEVYRRYKNVVNNRNMGNYFIAMLFWKYISDGWVDALEKYKAMYADDETMFIRKMERYPFTMKEHYAFDHVYSKRESNDIGDIINKALGELEASNAATLNNIFGHVDFNNEYDLGGGRERSAFLRELLELFVKVDLRPSRNQELLKVTEDCWSTIFSFTEINSVNGGEYVTPKDVCKLVAQLAQPGQAERIYDPFCGSGGFLIAAANEAPAANYVLYGQELNKEMRAWAVMNMYMRGLTNTHIASGDIIRNPVWKENDGLMKFDVVLSSLPFGSDSWSAGDGWEDSYDRFRWGAPPPKRGEYAFIQHMLASADETNGRVGVVVPVGVLFREGKELSIRKAIVEDNLLEAVIALPSNMFFHTPAPSAVLLFNKAKGTRKDVLFINASKLYDPGKRRNKIPDMHMERIISAYRKFKASENRDWLVDYDFCKISDMTEIAAANFNLTVSRYIDLAEAEMTDSINVIALERDISNLRYELETLKENLKRQKRDLGL